MNKFLALLACFSGTIFADFNHPSNKIEDDEITLFQVLGERCSGTNYVKGLISENFDKLQDCVKKQRFIHKHFIPWYLNEDLVDSNEYYKFPKKNILYVVVIRNAIDWIRSFYLQPHHVSHRAKKGFDFFIFSKWEPFKPSDLLSEKELYNSQCNWYSKECEESKLNHLVYYLDKKNPMTNANFQNIFELRTVKYLNYLKLREYVQNIIYVTYEDVKDNPEGFLDYISSLVNISRIEYKKIDTYKNRNEKVYKEKKYFDLSTKQKEQILNLLDMDLESSFGYQY
jgi:hypothetical protein